MSKYITKSKAAKDSASLKSIKTLNSILAFAFFYFFMVMGPGAFAQLKFSRDALVNHHSSTEIVEFYPNKVLSKALSISFLMDPGEKKKGSVAGSFIGSLLGGAIGFFGGGFLGYQIETDSGCSGDDHDWCGITGFFLGAAIGESLMMPIGAHAGNGGQGNLPINLLITTGVGGLGLALAASSNEPTALIAIPVLQLLTSIIVEQKTGRSLRSGNE